MANDKKYLFGPVPSRRLGLSLGVDIVPMKTCMLNCVYCQLGRSEQTIVERKEYVSPQAVLAQLEQRIAHGLKADYITLSGSGEPTLNTSFGRIIEGIKELTDIPIALITNATLMSDPAVRADACKVDLIVPSLDAGDEETFRRINRPHRDISIEKLIEGLCQLRKEFSGQIWLEVFLIEGINTTTDQIDKIARIARRIAPDKIQLNTAVRPTAEDNVHRLNAASLEAIAKRIGPNCQVVADFSLLPHAGETDACAEDILTMLKRRPCSLEDICSSLAMAHSEALKYIAHLQQQGLIESVRKQDVIFFTAKQS